MTDQTDAPAPAPVEGDQKAKEKKEKTVAKAAEPAPQEPLKTYPKDFNDPNREFFATLVPDMQELLVETIDSIDDLASVRAFKRSDGVDVDLGPGKIADLTVSLESRSGVIAQTDDQGTVHLQATYAHKDAKGKQRRSRFSTGVRVTAFTMGAGDMKSQDLRVRGRTARPLEIKMAVAALAKSAAEEAQRKGAEVDRKIIAENLEVRPPRLEGAHIASVRRDRELELDTQLVGMITSYVNEKLRRDMRNIQEVKVQCARFSEHYVFAGANGRMSDQVIPLTALMAYVKTAKGSEAFRAIRGSCGTLEECLKRNQPADSKKTIIEVLDEFCDKIREEAGQLDRADGAGMLGNRCPVILGPGVAGVFAHETLGHPSEGDIIAENMKNQAATFKLKSRLGAQISDNPGFGLIETPGAEYVVNGKTVLRHMWGALDVDQAGDATKLVTIVEKGIMVEAMTSRDDHEPVISGLKEDIVKRNNDRGLAGRARAENYSVPTQVRMTNTIIPPDPSGPSSPAEMARKFASDFSSKKGVYIQSCAGGWVDTNNGQFCINGNLCFLIENGVITDKPLKGVKITGKLGDLLPMIKGIGNVESMGSEAFTGFCGKNNQWVRVEGAGPVLYLKDCPVGGGGYGGYVEWSEVVRQYAEQSDEIRCGIREKHAFAIPEIESLRETDSAPANLHLATQFLPFDVQADVMMGTHLARPDYEAVEDEEGGMTFRPRSDRWASK